MNDTIFYFFYGLAHQGVSLDNIIIFFATYFPYLVVWFAVMFLLFHHDVFKAENPYQVFLQKRKEVMGMFYSGLVAWFLSIVLKILIHSPRPFDVLQNVNALFVPTDFSFPSGHAAFFSALAFDLFFLHRKVGYVFIVFALIIGIARIVAGVHFPVDILGGLVLGFVVAFVVKKLTA